MKTRSDFPEWAPRGLIEHYFYISSILPSVCEFDPGDPESYMKKIQLQFNGELSAENVEDIRQRLYRNSFIGLPRSEKAALLERLLTYPDMKEAWSSVESRTNCENDLIQFVQACEDSITGWRGDKKRTKKVKEVQLREIQNAAKMLQSLLDDCPSLIFTPLQN